MDGRIPFRAKLIWRYLFLFFIVVAAMKLTGGAGFAIVIPLAFWALMQNKEEDLFFYMLLTIAMVVANPNIVPKNMAFAVEQRGMMAVFGLILTLRVAGQKKAPLVKPLVGVLFYVTYMILPSLQGWCAPISMMKILLFVLVFLSYYGAANATSVNPRANMPIVRSMVLAIAIVFIWGSVALIPLPGYGMMRSRFLEAGQVERALSSYFMGMTSHSQCLGPMISGLAALLLADWVFGVRKFSKLYFGLLICCPILIWKTASRGGMLTFAMGVMFVVFLLTRASWVNRRWKGKVLMNLWAIAFIGFFVLLLNPSSRNSLQRFLVKHDVGEGEKVQVNVENFTSSRMGLVDRALTNFKESPLIGNGFQVSDEMKNVKIQSIKDLLSAPIEKGVWIVAVLEEGGVVGWVIFTTFLITAILKFIKYRAYISASVLLVFTASNMGEFSFFSMSYLGGFMWALVFAAVVLDSTRAKAEIF